VCGGCIWAGAVLLLHQAYGKASISYFIGMCSPVTFQHGNDGKRCPFAVKCAWKKNAYTFSPGSDQSVDWIMISCAGHDVGIQVILGEEVATSKMTLFDVTKQICDAIQARGEQGTMKPPSFVTLLSCKTVHAVSISNTGMVNLEFLPVIQRYDLMSRVFMFMLEIVALK
jgi:hypothetical protein